MVTFGDPLYSGLSSWEEHILPRELDRLETKEIFFKGIFFVSALGGDLDCSSLGEDRLVDKKLRRVKLGYAVVVAVFGCTVI